MNEEKNKLIGKESCKGKERIDSPVLVDELVNLDAYQIIDVVTKKIDKD